MKGGKRARGEGVNAAWCMCVLVRVMARECIVGLRVFTEITRGVISCELYKRTNKKEEEKKEPDQIFNPIKHSKVDCCIVLSEMYYIVTKCAFSYLL